jgi:hypothetical protein
MNIHALDVYFDNKFIINIVTWHLLVHFGRIISETVRDRWYLSNILPEAFHMPKIS